MARPTHHGIPSAHAEPHLSGRSGWLRAAVMGANDGILSTASLIVGVAAGASDHVTVMLAGIAGMVAGALSMAAGEYVSVSSQEDVEQADIAKERRELKLNAEAELDELAQIYETRGLPPPLAREVAEHLTEADALGAHLRDEIGLTDLSPPRPLQAAVVSALTFAAGASVPLTVGAVAPMESLQVWVASATLVALGTLGALGAQAGGASRRRGALRVIIWGVLAMAATSVIGSLVGAAL
ncbi:VIT1/CCC1 transporter family protein [Roseicyclus mahoneyensis]|uniref:VIT1/CCC1 family predicted Fe2+/Mn2+ transporter n=1 Tax=Roseicyclus mahoneyensis TaxID=164332 RepID=A0A316GMU0_9RHOB|nr:VIT family protein [Roseicyclus mahoneyensis]PWK62477.1 VIT1/CCC1 family predicted Fe2+/Mn2+ transporter [Roseicyclus mahoneyensis]